MTKLENGSFEAFVYIHLTGAHGKSWLVLSALLRMYVLGLVEGACVWVLPGKR